MHTPVYKKNKGIKLIRYGGLSIRKQKNDKAPEKHGMWAFIFPYWDWWFLSGSFSDIEGRFQKDGRYNKNLLKKFFYRGRIYSALEVPNSERVETPCGLIWYLTDEKSLYNHLGKIYARDLAFARKHVEHPVTDLCHKKNVYKYGNISVDHYEVFIPRK